jgi:hypothetical protein
MSKTNDGAISEELHGIDLGDQRLNKRSQRLIRSLAIDPQLSINASCEGWGETHAAYQFMDNAKVTPAKILKPHQAATLRRIQTQPVVLIPQDTTEFDFTAHPAKDAKCLNIEQRLGFYEHVQLAVTPQGLPLGVVGTDRMTVNRRAWATHVTDAHRQSRTRRASVGCKRIEPPVGCRPCAPIPRW